MHTLRLYSLFGITENIKTNQVEHTVAAAATAAAFVLNNHSECIGAIDSVM